MLFGIAAGLVIIMLLGSEVVRQRLRFRHIRRYRAQDRQKTLHDDSVFHVATFFRLRGGDKLIKTARLYDQQSRAVAEGKLIYAGQAAYTANCDELPDADWDGILLHEYSTREQFEKFRRDARSQLARSLFAEVYQHGMRRNRRLSAAIPRYFFLLKLKSIFQGRWRPPVLERSQAFATLPEFQCWRSRIDRLRALNEVNRLGLVVFNLVKFSREGGEMLLESRSSALLHRMAAEYYGPLHIGRALALEGLGRFDRMYAVYYPSALDFAELIDSQYFTLVSCGNTADSILQLPTVPITSQVEV